MNSARRNLLFFLSLAFSPLRSWGAEGLPATPNLSLFAIPQTYFQRIQDRSQIDQYIGTTYRTESPVTIRAIRPEPSPASARGGTPRILHDRWPEPVAAYRRSLPSPVLPLRGYRASLFDHSQSPWPVSLSADATPAERQAARLIEERLATDGVLSTLAQTIRTLGVPYLRAHPLEASNTLCRLGFPVDLLHYFRWSESSPHGDELSKTLSELWIRCSEEAGLDRALEQMRGAAFVCPPRPDGFQVATESGENRFGLIRVQLGGGLMSGVIPGSSVDFAGQLLQAVPDVDVMASVPEPYFEICHWLASRVWPLKRAGQLTLIGEPLPLTPWAQDNCKAGTLRSHGNDAERWAVLAPRYTSLNEGTSVFTPGEAFALEGVAKAGVVVEHSSLLFQGGNLLAIRDPSTGRRQLLIGEGEIARNRALGLSDSQVLQLFQVEFGVDDCKVLPAVSYHLDFDVSVREREKQLIAFVNQPLAAARAMVDVALTRFEVTRLMGEKQASPIRQALQMQRDAEASALMTASLQSFLRPGDRYADVLAEALRVDRYDAPSANLQCLLVAIDFLQAAGTQNGPEVGPAERRRYLDSIRRTLSAIKMQNAALKTLGMDLVEVPSFPDVRRSINYLNGAHDRSRYLMPAYGGVFAPLDQIAIAVFERALGADVKVIPLMCSESQRDYGAVHCMVCPFPQLATHVPPSVRP